MDKKFLGILGGLIIAFGAFFVISQNSNDSKTADTKSGTPPTNHVIGNASSGVTLLEYGDYQCPVCGLYYQPTKDAVESFKDVAQFQYRHLPLVGPHPNAFAAARAAEAASLQGKFWEMHDKLFENQSSWSSSTKPLEFFKSYAKELGLDVPKFETDYASVKVNDQINADITAFGKTGQQQATPTYFLNGRVINNKDLAGANGFPSAEKIKAIVQAEVDKQNK
jgi:protein-disulfide isomerase